MQFVEGETVVFQNEKDRKSVTQVMTIIYRILEHQKRLINTLIGDFY